jgi:hypothetical protein
LFLSFLLNKCFINSILTELIQNSVDAIRSESESSKYIDIRISNDVISITDYIGFDDIINILIPFLSSKNPNDPNVTGEMGTGFFNVYRKPWTRFVLIESVFNSIKKTIRATPLHENNIVYDIEYEVMIQELDEQNSTTISIFLEKDISTLSQIITDAFIFVNSYLSFIKSAIIRLNGSIVKKNYTIFIRRIFINFYSEYIAMHGNSLSKLRTYQMGKFCTSLCF